MTMLINKASSVLAFLDKIAATSSKIEKEALVKQGMGSPMFARIVRAAYTPGRNYGMRVLPERQAGIAPGGNTLDEERYWNLLTGLAEREITGLTAWEQVEQALNFLDESSGELLRRIIRGDLRAAFGTDTVNRVCPGTFPDYPYMRCSLVDKSNMAKWDWSQGMISQEKADGMFANLNRDGAGNVWMTTRQGTDIPMTHLQALEAAVISAITPNTQTHGELTVYRNGKLLAREVGNGILNSVCQGAALEPGDVVRFDAWDQIPLDKVATKGKYEVPYKARLVSLVRDIRKIKGTIHAESLDMIPTRLVYSRADAWGHYRELLRAGKEGTIVKYHSAIWRDGTSKDQVKLKLEVDVDLEVVSVLTGNVGTKNEGRPGSLECRTSCSGLSVDVTVKNEKMRAEIEANPDAFIGKVMVVRANSIMEASNEGEMCSLFLPRFVDDKPRLDKTIADTLEQVREQFRNAVNA